MAEYFGQASADDGAWAVLLLTGRKLRNTVNRTKLRNWVTEMSLVPDWLFGECYDAVGDLAETIAKVLPVSAAGETSEGLAWWIEKRLQPLSELNEQAQELAMKAAWRELTESERFIWNKLLTGSFRVGVSQELVVRALAQVSGVPTDTLSHRLMGTWHPSAEWFAEVIAPDAGESDHSKPYPFCLAHPLGAGPEELGLPSEWVAEWKWDGIRAQLIRRRGESFLWSRGEGLIHATFPELAGVGAWLPDGTVIDGEAMAWKEGAPMAFQDLQKRLGRRDPSRKLFEDVPAVLVAFDLLEWDGEDFRKRPLSERRDFLEKLVESLPELPLRMSPQVPIESWAALAEVREKSAEKRAEGLMLKHRDSEYVVGRKRGAWWKWKVAPMTVDAVLIYAQRGSGKRASLYTDYTFGVWSEGTLVPIAKAYSGLTDEEISRVDAFVRRNGLEKFGPVRTVKPELVFELAFEGIQMSSRHKSGIAVRFPRILRWRNDKHPEDADSLEAVKALLMPSAG